MISVHLKSYGPSQFIWNRLLFCLSCLWFQRLEKQKLSLPITLFCLGSYRALYILNWIYRYHSEGFFDLIAIIAGIVQTVLYCDFFYLYITKVIKGKALKLPA
ncbi:ER lumen protein-retaining receptor 1 [Caerostris darwini]|uniref:ER lumen protein-retaining receptor 1 n=1 Tax=Caerostris darwini TaxID=1538125 RepID=A0AAV4RNZ6_9ARAC|nr:ER lumen protein-retaining receptor 1 [Caerostris darwini]